MTICIAIMCEGGKQIVSVSDHMLSMEHFTADGLTLKTEYIHPNWFAMCSKNVSYVPALMECVRKQLNVKEEFEWLDISSAFQNAHKAVTSSEINSSILAKHGYDIASFYKRGKAELTASAFSQIHREIKEFTLDAEFLVCGFDGEGHGHIFTFEDGSTKSCDKAGMWAIGSGSFSALSTLFYAAKQYNFNQNKPLQVALYAALSAKFMSESAEAVGGQTFLNVNKLNHLTGYIDGTFVHQFRAKWFEQYSLRWPSEVMDELKSNFKEGKKFERPPKDSGEKNKS